MWISQETRDASLHPLSRAFEVYRERPQRSLSYSLPFRVSASSCSRSLLLGRLFSSFRPRASWYLANPLPFTWIRLIRFGDQLGICITSNADPIKFLLPSEASICTGPCCHRWSSKSCLPTFPKIIVSRNQGSGRLVFKIGEHLYVLISQIICWA